MGTRVLNICMMEEKELFQDYELKSWELSPRIYKVIGAAAALHLFGLLVFSQVDLLGTKACDSPYVGKVCQVLDAAYISSTLLGTDTEFSSRDYDKTEINEEDVTWVNVGEQFAYPAGYFSQANPVPPGFDPAMTGGIDPATGMPYSFSTGGMNIPGITTSPSTLDPTTQPMILPTPNPNAVQGPLPDSPLGTGSNPTITTPRISRPSRRTQRFPSGIRPPRNNSPNTLPNIGDANANQTTANKDKNNPNANTTASNENKAKPAETPKPADDVKLFNRKPLEDFAAEHGDEILNNQVDLNAPFTIEVIARLSENGKLINPKMVTTADSDPKMSEVAKKAILAFGDSQLLLTLYNAIKQSEPGSPLIRIRFAQDASNLQANIQVETRSENKAKEIQSSLQLLLKLAKLKEGSDEQVLINKAELGTNGKNFVIGFLISNEEKTALIRKNLEKEQQKREQKKPSSGVAETANRDVNSAR